MSIVLWVSRLLLGVVAVIIASVPLLVVTDAVRDRRAERAFAHIHIGDTEAKVVALLGAPDTEKPCSEWAGNDFAYRHACVTEARYGRFISTWVVVYTAQRRVLDTHHDLSD